MKTSLNIGRSVDWRSLVIGLLVGMILLLSLGLQSNGQMFTGRYMGVSAGSSFIEIFIVDRYTGEVWLLDGKETVEYGSPYRYQLKEPEEED
ncbi:MAG: hypothetical protein K9M75_01670 [Phycisphaerae bacterium]|nr:hypothetical protein [Phycisphaerae bacterium]